MERIRKKYICKKQIKKGTGGVRELLKLYKKGYSIALMIDQRVSEGIKSKFFNEDAFTTTIPAQFIKRFNCKIVPIYIERRHGINFNIKIEKPKKFSKEDSIEKITRDLNIWLEKNVLMERIRKKYICKKQIKKGTSGIRELLKLYKKGYSIALMIDQRVSEGIKSKFFNEDAFTTTIPAQFIKKFNCKIVPIYIERHNDINFDIKIEKPIEFLKDTPHKEITRDLNIWLEKMILKNPTKWIWSHNRWK